MEMEKVKKELMHMFHAWRILLGSLVKWILLSIVIGGVIGVIASAFANLITWATDFRMGHMWMVYLLPFAGLMIVFLYHVTGQEKNAGTDMEYDAGKSGTIDFDCDSFDAFVWRFCRPGRCGTSVWGKPRKLART